MTAIPRRFRTRTPWSHPAPSHQLRKNLELQGDYPQMTASTPKPAEVLIYLDPAGVLRPGDILVLQSRHPLTAPDTTALREALTDLIPDIEITVVDGTVYAAKVREGGRPS